jgi:N-acetylglucosaminyldiphosphoundecaprenol N-acetyl-beta-D-mannosaminyltransferase
MTSACTVPDEKIVRPRDRVIVTGTAVDNLTEDETLALIDRLVAEPCTHYMVVVNAAKLVAARQDPELKQILEAADIVTADGMSVVWASRLLGQRLKQRVTGIDTLSRLVELAELRGLSVFFLGSTEESVSDAVKQFRASHPALKIAGYRNGYFSAQEAESIAESIQASRADLLFVGMGSPAQEKFIAANAAACGVRFALGVGGSFDHICGRSKRAPLWMQRCGLEWLHRVALDPRRLWRRYLVGNTKFIWLVCVQRMFGRTNSV